MFLRRLEGKGGTTAVSVTSSHHFLLVQVFTAAAVVERLVEFRGSSVRLILKCSYTASSRQNQMFASLLTAPQPQTIMELLSARLH